MKIVNHNHTEKFSVRWSDYLGMNSWPFNNVDELKRELISLENKIERQHTPHLKDLLKTQYSALHEALMEIMENKAEYEMRLANEECDLRDEYPSNYE